MPIRRKKEFGETATSLLATTIVVVGGTAACLVVILPFASKPFWPMTIVVAGVLGLAFLTWLLSEAPKNRLLDSEFFWLTRRVPKTEREYVPRIRRSRKTGTNQPPTLEQVRNLKENTSTWVPSGPHPSSKGRTEGSASRNSGA
jgi:hypothetical protein